MYVADATVVLPPSRDKEEGTGGYKKILLFGGFIFLLVVIFVFGIVFNLQTEVSIVLSLFIHGKEEKYSPVLFAVLFANNEADRIFEFGRNQ